ncbi:MAG: aminotransferase class I/II-fold pyridoxal phosphate-dependent enzyme, partial [Moorea sp. SIO3C2]|nr:aminotransferase class I/II-fold pyridoxal phosphate-dependent enzyme [Moorena sp. SIO3C2]
DSPDMKKLSSFCSKNELNLVVDEAHALGVFGKGMINELKLEDSVFARIFTFGKSLGCHGAAILGSTQLKTFLINFARSLIYTMVGNWD